MESVNKMKTLKGLDALKYMALYKVFMYEKTKHASYRRLLERIVEKAITFYGLDELTELLDFIQAETE